MRDANDGTPIAYVYADQGESRVPAGGQVKPSPAEALAIARAIAALNPDPNV